MTDYLLDTCIIIEILRGNEKTLLWLRELNDTDTIAISGWTILELLKEKKSKTEMENCLRKLLAKYKIFWTKPEFCDEIPELLIKHFHTQRENNGKLKGNCVFDCFIYETSKSNNNLIIVTRNGDFDFVKDVEILNLNKEDRYKII
jgi:predicted nucleic acid-binding protein